MEESHVVGEQNENKRKKLKSKESLVVGEQNENKRKKLKSKESLVVAEQDEIKRRKSQSKVWDEFTKLEIDGKQWAICNHCGSRFDGSSEKGTTHLRNHLQSIKCRAIRKGGDGNEDKSIMCMKEKSSVIEFIKSSSDPRVLNSKKAEILQVYEEEMESLSKLSCRFSLEFVEVMNSALLIIHYIDDSWEQQRKVIGQCNVFEDSIEDVVKRACSDRKIDRNICSVVDPSFYLGERGWFYQQGSLPFAGFVPNDLEEYLFDFVSQLHECAESWETVKIDDYGVVLIMHIAYYQIKVAVGFKEAFSELEKIDPHFSSLNLTKVQWDEAIATFEHLKALQKSYGSMIEATSKFLKAPPESSNNIPKAIDPFEHLKVLQESSDSLFWDNYNRIKDILKLVRCNRNADCHVCKHASHQIKKSVDQYWSKSHLILDTVVILDPRFKIEAVRRWYQEIYDSHGDVYVEKTIKYFSDVYNEYAKDTSNYISGDANSSKSFKMLDAMGRSRTSSPKSELDVYLDELQVPAVEEFDILAWWRGNAAFYPTLARMARDYLAIPIFRKRAIDSSLKDEIKYCEPGVDVEILPALIYFKDGCKFLQSDE